MTTAARPEAVWSVWADAEHWGDWNPTVKWVRCDGPFASGTKGKLKPATGPATSFEIAEVDSGRSWVLLTRLPGALMRLEHVLTENAGGGCEINYHGRLTGPLAPLIVRFMTGPLAGAVDAVHLVAARAAERS